jgi:hypothetical protein
LAIVARQPMCRQQSQAILEPQIKASALGQPRIQPAEQLDSFRIAAVHAVRDRQRLIAPQLEEWPLSVRGFG